MRCSLSTLQSIRRSPTFQVISRSPCTASQKVYDELMKQNGKNINGHSLKVTQAENITDLGQAQIIYLADGKSASLDDILKATEGKPIMII